METIMNYLNTMFATVAQTEQMQKIKNDLAANMEDKYHELKAEGKSENEAVGTVISEFGNIDELLKEIGIAQPAPQAETSNEKAADTRRVVTKEETDAYLDARKIQNFWTAIGVVLILLGASAMMMLYGIYDINNTVLSGIPEDLRDVLPVVLLLVTVIIAVALFITSGTKFERYAYMEEGVALPEGLRKELSEKMERDREKNAMVVAIGVTLCLLGVIVLLVLGALSGSNDMFGPIGVASLLIFVAVACFLFICPGGMKEGYEKLLGTGEFAPEKVKGNKIVGIVASVVWPLAVAVFLVWGLAFQGWAICWIVFPVVGICFGAFAAACGAIAEQRQK